MSREEKENQLIDVYLRARLSEALNIRSEVMKEERIKNPGVTIKRLQRKVVKSLILKEKLAVVQKKWYEFCLKPKKRGVIGITTWKKVTPNREAYKINLDSLLAEFDKNELQMFKEQGAINIGLPWYTKVFDFIMNLFKKPQNV